VSLGLSNNLSAGAFAPEPRHKSAGLAFGLSLLLPGLGQFYCDKIARGGLTLGFWLAAVVLCFADVSKALIAEGLLVTLVLWIFSFLDAYFTAVEINQRQDDQIDVQNPRVAVTLNLLTAGLGYFYLGERAKGIAIFLAMQVARLVFPATRSWGVLVAVVLLLVRVLAAYDAYRIARRQVKEALGP
jgi:TM2 domain-containing membrane protein YozV